MGNIEFNRARFLNLAYAASLESHARFNIGTYKEKKLHLVLKHYFTDSSESLEIPVEGFIADIKNAEGITEIQTSGFASMREKLEAFLPLGPLTVVYPIAKRKWVSWIEPETGDISPKNRSPKTGRPFDVIPELIYIRDYLTHPNLRIRTVLLEIEEYRMLDGKRSRSRKRGSHRYERIPTDIFGIYDFASPADYIACLPELPELFTAAELIAAAKYRGHDVSAVMRVLEAAGAIVREGKRGRAFQYRISEKNSL